MMRASSGVTKLCDLQRSAGRYISIVSCVSWCASAARLAAAFVATAALSLGISALDAAIAWERPTAPSVLCSTYPTLARCAGAVPNCSICHTSTDPPAWNAFGQSVAQRLDRARDFESALPDALRAVE